MSDLIGAERTLITLLIVVAIVAITVRRIRLPYTVALVLSGLAIAIIQPLPGFELTSEIIMAIFLPPLLFEAAFHLEVDELRESLPHILTLAVPGVLLSALIIAGVLTLGTNMPLAVGLVFGALISATDPVAVLAVFSQLGVPRRLSYLVEGESLFNDGTAIVIYRLLLGIAISGYFSPVDSVTRFVQVTLGGTILGLVAGYVFSLIIRPIDDYLIEITLTTILAYGTFILAEELRISGVIAVVVSGIVVGNYGARIGMSPTTRVILVQIWEYIAFIANSLIFLLIGLAIDLPRLMQYRHLILWGVVATLIARAAVIYGTTWSVERLLGKLPTKWRHVLFWGGLRGAIALALALSLPADLGPWQDPLRVMSFGAVLFTLLVQGTTIQLLLQRLGMAERRPRPKEYEMTKARLYALQAAWRRLNEMNQDGVLSPSVWQELNREYRLAGQQISDQIQLLYDQYGDLEQQELRAAQCDALRAQRNALNDMRRRGLISEEVYRELVYEVDHRLEALGEIT